jgi:hypothetical protein
MYNKIEATAAGSASPIVRVFSSASWSRLVSQRLEGGTCAHFEPAFDAGVEELGQKIQDILMNSKGFLTAFDREVGKDAGLQKVELPFSDGLIPVCHVRTGAGGTGTGDK